MKVTLTFTADNDAFASSEEQRLDEVARLVENIGWRIRAQARSGPLVDLNGNTVGEWEFEEDDSDGLLRV